MNPFKSATERHLENLDEERLYSSIADELASGVINRGLYAKALADTGGDEPKGKARYIELRARAIKTERAAQEEQRQRLLADEARVAQRAQRNEELHFVVVEKETNHPLDLLLQLGVALAIAVGIAWLRGHPVALVIGIPVIGILVHGSWRSLRSYLNDD